MPTKIAINGFGRIGRCIVRALSERKHTDIELVAINDLTDSKTLAHLYNYDTVHRRAKHPATSLEGALEVDGKKVKVTAEKDPGKLPLKELGVDIVLECTGLFADKEKCAPHFAAGAKKVIISAPAKHHDITIVLGVNEKKYDPAKHTIISNASCTTNCLVPMVKIIRDNFGFVRGSMVTIHSYTNDQNVLEWCHQGKNKERDVDFTGSAMPPPEAISGKYKTPDGHSIQVPPLSVAEKQSLVRWIDLGCPIDLDFDSEHPGERGRAAHRHHRQRQHAEAEQLQQHPPDGLVAEERVEHDPGQLDGEQDRRGRPPHRAQGVVHTGP